MRDWGAGGVRHQLKQMKKEKLLIYCKNCKWFYRWSYPWNIISSDFCDYEIWKENKEISKIIGESRGHYENVGKLEELNKNNDCPFYCPLCKHKFIWWKFW